MEQKRFEGLVLATGQPIYGRSKIEKYEEDGTIYFVRVFESGIDLWDFKISDLKLRSGEIVTVYQGFKRNLIEVDSHISEDNLKIT